MTKVALQISEVGLRIAGVEIIKDISLDIHQGETLAIIGPNGAGKTSLLNLITGTVRATSGSLRLLDRNITTWAPHRRAGLGLGRTFQTSYLFLGLTVLENVRLMAQARSNGGWSALRLATKRDPSRQTALNALSLVGLDRHAEAQASELSHGDRRKLELAIVLAAEPAVILLDEPMAGVNMEDIDGLVALIQRVKRETHATIVLVEHHMHVVMDLADRVAVMHHGALLACDTPARVMSDETVRGAYLGEPL